MQRAQKVMQHTDEVRDVLDVGLNELTDEIVREGGTSKRSWQGEQIERWR